MQQVVNFFDRSRSQKCVISVFGACVCLHLYLSLLACLCMSDSLRVFCVLSCGEC